MIKSIVNFSRYKYDTITEKSDLIIKIGLSLMTRYSNYHNPDFKTSYKISLNNDKCLPKWATPIRRRIGLELHSSSKSLSRI